MFNSALNTNFTKFLSIFVLAILTGKKFQLEWGKNDGEGPLARSVEHRSDVYISIHMPLGRSVPSHNVPCFGTDGS